MIPIRLELRNFLPYRSPAPLIFDGIHLACLTGSNGAGKSSLLDAITWALWGKARVNQDDELIHLGQTEMSVQLDFEQEGQRWRVVRQRSGGKRGKSKLNLFLLDGDDPQLQTESGINQTQKRINQLLRMDYETFIHSAFLQQGKADAFTRLQPAKRKEILTEILGLNQWETYESEAKDQLKIVESNLAVLESRIQEINQELLKRPEWQRVVNEAQQRHTELIEQVEALRAETQALEHLPGELNQTRHEHKTEQTRRDERLAELRDVEARQRTEEATLSQHQQIIAQREEIEQGYNHLQAAQETYQSLSAKLQELRRLEGQESALQKDLERERASLETSIREQRRQITDLEKQISAINPAEIAQLEEQLEALRVKDAELEAHKAETDQLRALETERQQRFTTIETEGKELTKRIDQLEATDQTAANCPLCGQPLDEHHFHDLLAELNAERTDKRNQYTTAKQELESTRKRIQEQQQHIKQLEKELKKRQELDSKLGQQRERAQQIDTMHQRITELEQSIAELQARLTQENFGAAIREQLDQLHAEKDALYYNDAEYNLAAEQLKAYKRYDDLHRQLGQAQSAIESIERAIADHTARAHRLTEVIQQSEQTIARLNEQITALEQQVAVYQQKRQELAALEKEERKAETQLITAQQELTALDKQDEQKREKEHERDEARHHAGLLTELKTAFGKNGVPAMIIETAIPELESSANQLLGRMTDGRMSLRFDTQREKVTGGSIETLDINIADELGTRSYDLYSGGEAFRINFAIRVALSQMLARRAGAHLRALFIDEGFGTQDDVGREKIIEAINAIQDKFDMILVITHLADLRDSFPVHIIVEKTPNGSQITLR